MFDPHRAIAQGAAQVQERGNFRSGKGPFAILAIERLAPDAAQRHCAARRQCPQVPFIQPMQQMHDFEQWMRRAGFPRQRHQSLEQRAHRAYRLD